jgi:hypothetical protein
MGVTHRLAALLVDLWPAWHIERGVADLQRLARAEELLPVPGAVTVRARFSYPMTRHAALRFPWLTMRDMTKSREAGVGA